uniref:Protein krueppel n=1 Tax=Anopheles culicifacies TaxID=139723 RepID=A0A182MSA6_9DIPT
MEAAKASKPSSGMTASSPAERSKPVDEKQVAEASSDEFCRICLLKSTQLKPLMERVDGVMIPEMLYKLCGRQIEVQEGYPRSICQRCLCRLDCAFRFLNDFHQQDERLRSFYWSGSVAKRLQEYQVEGNATANKRMDELNSLYKALFKQPAKQMCNKETNTIKQKSPKTADVGTITDKELINLQLVKSEDDSDGEIMLEHYVMEEDNEETYLDYCVDGETTLKDQQLVAMKIDLLQSTDEAESCSEEKPSRAKEIKGTRQQQQLSKATKVKVALSDTMEESIPTDTDDPAHEQVYYEDTETEQEEEEEEEEEEDQEQEGKFDDLRCYICDIKEENEDLLEQHLDLHSTMLPYDCKSCHAEGVSIRTIKTVSSLHNHFRSHLYPYWCDICGKRYLRKMQLKKHKENHTNSLFVCDECGRGFTHKKTWQNHIKRHKALRAEMYKCSTCDKAFGNKARLDRHMRLHTGDRPFECKYCDKRYYDRHQLQCHTEKHFREVDCACEYCGETFAGTKKLEAHKVAKHLTGKELDDYLANRAKRTKRQAILKDETCPYPDCNYKAKTYGAMYVHKRTKHAPMHPCGICGKSFAFQNQLEVHMKLHTGEKPFQCELCGRSFRRGFSYREHMEMHTSQASYNCPTCNKSFKRPRYLQAHMLTHTSERKFSCEICGNCYKTNGELKKHNKNKHGLDIVEQDVIIETDDQYIVEYV